MLTIIGGGDVYAPAPLGRRDILACGDSIASVGDVDRRAVEAIGSLLNMWTHPAAWWCRA